MTIRNPRFRRDASLSLLLTALLIATGAHQSKAAPRAQRAKKTVAAKKKAAPATPTKVTLIPVTDPVEKSFTVKLPKGWRNQAYLARLYQMYRPIVTSLSPDGKTLLFYGDPRLPSYTLPSQYTAMPEYQMIAQLNPLVKVSNYVPAKNYFTGYIRNKFGRLPNFRITSTTPNPELMNDLRKVIEKSNNQARAETIRIQFSYTENGKPMRALINGYTMAYQSMWWVDVSGVTTSGDPMRYNNLLRSIVASHRTDPQWNARQQALHEQRMAQMQNDHQNQIASWNASNQRHQLRMQAIQDAGNANMQKWYQKQAKSDDSHRAFLNTITEEKTVVDKSGNAYQVDNSHQRYFVNKHDKTYVGTNSYTSLNDLQGMGFDPSDYEEVKVKR